MKWTAKKTILIVFFLLISLILFLILLFISPQVDYVEMDIEVYGNAYFKMKDESPEDFISYVNSIFQMAKNGTDSTVQLFTDREELPSSNAQEYALVKVFCEARSRSVWKTLVSYLRMDACDSSTEMFICSTPAVRTFSLEPFSEKGKLFFQFIIYTGGKSQAEIEEALHSIILQIPYSNRVHSGDSIYVNCKDADIVNR